MVKILFALVGAATLIALFSPEQVSASTPRCYSDGEACPVSPSFCCNGCCKNGVCISFDNDVPDHCTDSCSRAYCPQNTNCVPAPARVCSSPPCALPAPGTCVPK